MDVKAPTFLISVLDGGECPSKIPVILLQGNIDVLYADE
jgi:hypothetical protein